VVLWCSGVVDLDTSTLLGWWYGGYGSARLGAAVAKRLKKGKRNTLAVLAPPYFLPYSTRYFPGESRRNVS
jgi:hypothetical protein